MSLKKNGLLLVVSTLSVSATALVIGLNNAENRVDALVGNTVTIGAGTYTSLYETGFENCPAATAYQETKNYTAEQADGASWQVYYGTVSTTNCLTGSKSAHMRLYSSGIKPYCVMTSSVENVKALKFNYAVSNKNVKFDVLISSDQGANWTTVKSVSPTGTAKTEVAVELDSSVSDFRLKFLATAGNPSSGNYTWRVDDIVLGGEVEDHVITALSVSPTTKNYTLGSILERSQYTPTITKDGAVGSYDDIFAEIGKKTDGVFTKRESIVWGTSKVTSDDNALRFAAKYPTASGGDVFLEAFVDISWEYATLTSFAATDLLTIDSGKTGKILITVNENANPGATFVSGNEAVATVDENGVVTAHKSGTATITATSLGKNSSGVSMTSATTINVLAAPIFEKSFVGTDKTGFASQADAQKDTISDTKEFVTGYPMTVVANPSEDGAKIMSPTNSGQQYGTTAYPFESFSIKSCNFGGNNIDKVTVVVAGASTKSIADFSVKVGGQSFICATGGHIQSNNATTLEFTGSSYGQVEISCTNITAGIYVRSIVIYGEENLSSDAAKANAFARLCEMENSCEGTHTELFAAYEALESEVKTIADAIVIDDWASGDSSHQGARVASMTVAQKMLSLEASSVVGAKILGLSSDETAPLIVIISVIGLAGISAGYFLLRKKRA
ncbi:MAG: Ig-like domain-containing protein [Bacilli bacterium]|nr:Ig-like domain-containing protein [Bacilli bacterium]